MSFITGLCKGSSRDYIGCNYVGFRELIRAFLRRGLCRVHMVIT